MQVNQFRSAAAFVRLAIMMIMAIVVATSSAPAASKSTEPPSEFPVPWDIDKILAAELWMVSGPPLYRVEQWRPGIAAADFDAMLDRLHPALSTGDRDELVREHRGHEERMKALHASIAQSAWDQAIRINEHEKGRQFSRELMRLALAEADRMASAEQQALDDARALLHRVTERAPTQEDVEHNHFAVIADSFHAIQCAPSGRLHAQSWPAGIDFDPFRAAWGSVDSAAAFALGRAAFEHAESCFAPRNTYSRLQGRRSAVFTFLRANDEEMSKEVRRRAEVPEGRHAMIEVRQRVFDAIDRMEESMGPSVAFAVGEAFDSASFPEAFPDPRKGRAICHRLVTAPPHEVADRRDGIEVLAVECAALDEIERRLRENELELAYFMNVQGNTEQQAVEGERRRTEERPGLLAERERLNVDLAEAIEAVLGVDALRALRRAVGIASR